jgi:formyl-CoA transferase
MILQGQGIGRELKLIGSPIRMSASPVELRRPPPSLGQHTAEVFGDDFVK